MPVQPRQSVSHVSSPHQSLEGGFRDYTQLRTQETGSPLPHESHIRRIGGHGFLRNISTWNVQGRSDAFITVRMAVPF